MIDYNGNPIWSGNRIDYHGVVYDIIKVYHDRVKVVAQDNRLISYLTPAQVALSDRLF